MSSKPVVVALMPTNIFNVMFREENLSELRSSTELHGPYENSADAPSDLLARCDIALTGWGSPRFDTALLARLPKLRFIAYSAGSLKGVATDAVYDRGIRVTTSASWNAVPVAQFTVMAIASLLKQVPFIAASYSKGDTQQTLRRYALCRELQDLNVAIIGASRVGREVIRLLAPYPRLTIKLYDPYVSAETAKELGVQLVSLEEACGCEVVSIHAPNIPETRHMFNAQRLKLLPDHAVLINTSRGALIDEDALIAELNRRPIYVALDVTDPEPPVADSPLRTHENVLLTPHIAGALKQARRDMGDHAIRQIFRFLDNQPLEDEVTRAMLPTQA